MFTSLPSRGKQLVESPFVWLKEKAERDRARTGVPSQLWYIEGEIYDLSQFAKSHPGGEEFIKLTQGQDITEMFYSHHLDLEKCRSILKKYYVRESDRVEQYFDFSENGFYRTLHKKVANHFKNHDNSPTLAMNITFFITLFSFFGTFAMTCISQSYLWAIACGYTLYVCFGLGHNLLHKGPREPRRYIADLMFFSHYHWYISHCISHHHFANSNIDYEMTAFEPYYITTKSRLPNNKFFWYYINIFFGFVSLLEFISKLASLIKGEQKLRKEYLIPFLEYAVLYVSCGDAWMALKLQLTMQWFASFLMLKYSLLTHRNTYTISDGSDIVPSKDFGIYTIQATTDNDTWIKFPLNMFIFQGFNDHCLHHMFPTVDESRIPELHCYLDETLKQFNLTNLYKSYSVIDLYNSHNKYVSS